MNAPFAYLEHLTQLNGLQMKPITPASSVVEERRESNKISYLNIQYNQRKKRRINSLTSISTELSHTCIGIVRIRRLINNLLELVVKIFLRNLKRQNLRKLMEW
jgi:hypothetical protein